MTLTSSPPPLPGSTYATPWVQEAMHTSPELGNFELDYLYAITIIIYASTFLEKCMALSSQSLSFSRHLQKKKEDFGIQV